MQRPTPLEKRGRTIEGWAKLLLTERGLDRVALNITLHGFTAHGYPDRHGPVVKERREAAYAEAAAHSDSISLADATEINTAAAERPIGLGRGKSISEALADLESNLPDPR